MAIGAVLTAGPRILVLDEPTSALDPAAAEEVLAALTRLVHDLGITVLIAEHRLERVVQYADRVVIVGDDDVSFDDGAVPRSGGVRVGPPAEQLAVSPVVPPVVALGRAVGWSPLPLSVRDARRRAVDLRTRLAGVTPTPRVRPVGDVLVHTKDLFAGYGSLVVLRGVDIQVRRGEVVALMGRNGAGKSTLLDQLVGLGAPARGGVDLQGAAPHELSAAEVVRRVGLVPQDGSVLLYHDTVAAECSASDGDSGLPEGTTRRMVDRLVPGLDPSAHPRDLSEGQRLGLALAIVLAAEPPLVLLDEPTRGLDYAAKARLGTIIDELADEGRGVVLATHDVEVVAAVADRAVVLAGGEVVADGPARDVVVALARLRSTGREDHGPRTVAHGGRGRGRVAQRGAGVSIDEPLTTVGPTSGSVGPIGSVSAVRLGWRSWALLIAASALGVVAFGWPLLASPTGSVDAAHAADAPWLFVVLLPLLLAVLFAELAEGSLDAKAIALLGVLAALGAALRLPSGGVAGFEPVFFLLIPAGRVLGRGFGFVLGALTLFVSALLTGGVGPWLPFQMFGAAWIGFFAGCLPAWRGRAEVVMLAAYAAVGSAGVRRHPQSLVLALRRRRRDVGVVRGGCRPGREPVAVLGLPPRDIARLRPPPCGVHGRVRAPRRSTDPGRAASSISSGCVRRTGGLRPGGGATTVTGTHHGRGHTAAARPRVTPLIDAGFRVVVNDEDRPWSAAELGSALADAGAVITMLSDRIDASVLDAAPRPAGRGQLRGRLRQHRRAGGACPRGRGHHDAGCVDGRHRRPGLGVAAGRRPADR